MAGTRLQALRSVSPATPSSPRRLPERSGETAHLPPGVRQLRGRCAAGAASCCTRSGQEGYGGAVPELRVWACCSAPRGEAGRGGAAAEDG